MLCVPFRWQRHFHCCENVCAIFNGSGERMSFVVGLWMRVVAEYAIHHIARGHSFINDFKTSIACIFYCELKRVHTKGMFVMQPLVNEKWIKCGRTTNLRARSHAFNGKERPLKCARNYDPRTFLNSFYGYKITMLFGVYVLIRRSSVCLCTQNAQHWNGITCCCVCGLTNFICDILMSFFLLWIDTCIQYWRKTHITDGAH